jgi:hypothetical protein
VNYRPPSKYGRAVPITDNIYHADPSQPRHNDVFSRSLQSGTLKQCNGKSNRAECLCTDAQRTSKLVENSDCIDRVNRPTAVSLLHFVMSYFEQATRIFYSVEYMPNILVTGDGKTTSPLLSEYRLEEVNQRTDFCSKRICHLKTVHAMSLRRCTSAQVMDALVERTRTFRR